MEIWGLFLKTFLDGSLDKIIYRNYIANRRSLIYCSLASVDSVSVLKTVGADEVKTDKPVGIRVNTIIHYRY